MASPLGLLGLARKAGRLQLGASAVEQQFKQGGAALLLVASDASPSVARHAKQWAANSGVEIITIPDTKETFGRAMGRRECAVAVLTDQGFAQAYRKLITDPS